MRVAILGPGDVELISKHTSMNKEDVKKFINDFGKFLAEINAELIIAVDRGIPYEVAKIYKKSGGRKVYGVNPESHEKYDKKEQIKPFLDIIDEEIKVASWYHLNGEIASFSDVAVAFGLSCGTMADIVFLYFHYKYLKSETKLIMYLPSMSGKLHPEIEESLSVKGKKFSYAKNFEELKKKLLDLAK